MILEITANEYLLLAMSLENRKDRIKDLIEIFSRKSDSSMIEAYTSETKEIDTLLSKLTVTFLGAPIQELNEITITNQYKSTNQGYEKV